MTDSRQRELELVAKLAVTEADLKMTKEIGKVHKELASIPPMVDDKIKEYDDRQTRRRQWIARTLFIVASLVIAAIGLGVHGCVG